MSQVATQPKTLITDEDVELFLLDHPNFFIPRDGLLAELTLPHERGGAISLVEKQISVLRERNRELRKRLNQLLDAARENDRLFLKTQELVLNLLEAQSLDDIATTLQSSLRDDYQVDTSSLILFGTTEKFTHVNAHIVTLDEARTTVGVIMNSDKATCGTLREVEMAFLFPNSLRPENSRSIGSAAVAPLKSTDTGIYGLLAVGSFDPNRYRSDTGTLFLSYLAKVLDRVVPRYLT